MLQKFEIIYYESTHEKYAIAKEHADELVKDSDF